jgi:hypothetical protein
MLSVSGCRLLPSASWTRLWKPWLTFDGTPVLVPGAFATEPDANGHILMYPEGEASAPPSARIPNGGFYFDAIVRQEPLEGKQLYFEDNLEEFRPTSPAAVAHVK